MLQKNITEEIHNFLISGMLKNSHGTSLKDTSKKRKKKMNIASMAK